MTHIRGLITILITTHEPPRMRDLGSGPPQAQGCGLGDFGLGAVARQTSASQRKGWGITGVVVLGL